MLAPTARLFSISMVDFDLRDESMARFLTGAEYCWHDMSTTESWILVLWCVVSDVKPIWHVPLRWNLCNQVHCSALG